MMPSKLMRCSVLACTVLAGVARGAPIVETDGRLEINWSTQRLRFFGEAKVAAPAGDDDEALRNTERLAWQDGVGFASSAVRELFPRFNRDLEADSSQLAQDAQAVAKLVVSATNSVSTTYFADGTVRVLLEAPLGQLLASPRQRFRQKLALTPGSLQFTGVVVRLDRPVAPRPRYRIVDEQGQTLFEATDMAEDSFRKGLMGRWYRKPTLAELQDAVGAKPAALEAAVVSDGVWRVERAAWTQLLEGHRTLLVNGMLAIALP